MAKAKMYPVIIDRSVVVELKDKPTITYPAGWRGEVNKTTLKVIKDMEAGREVDDEGGAAADADTSDSDIKAKHDAADNEIANALKDAREKSVEMLDAAKSQSDQMIADAEKQAQKIVDDAAKASGNTGA